MTEHNCIAPNNMFLDERTKQDIAEAIQKAIEDNTPKIANVAVANFDGNCLYIKKESRWQDMTEQEAVEYWKEQKYIGRNAPNDYCNAVDMALKALEEIQQYRALGTVEELKSMKENGAFTGVELAQLAAMQMRLKKYESIGTVEELRVDRDKQVAMKPICKEMPYSEEVGFNDEWYCPACGAYVGYFTEGMSEPEQMEYCNECGQHIAKDWSDEDE